MLSCLTVGERYASCEGVNSPWSEISLLWKRNFAKFCWKLCFFFSCFAVLFKCCVFWNDKDVNVCAHVCVYMRAFGLCEWAGAYTHRSAHAHTHTHTYTGSEAERLSPLPPFDLCPQACLPALRCTVPRALTPCSPATPHNCLTEISQGRLQTVLLLFH